MKRLRVEFHRLKRLFRLRKVTLTFTKRITFSGNYNPDRRAISLKYSDWCTENITSLLHELGHDWQVKEGRNLSISLPFKDYWAIEVEAFEFAQFWYTKLYSEELGPREMDDLNMLEGFYLNIYNKDRE